MGIEENKKIIQRYFDELHNKQDYSKADEILHTEYSGAAGGGIKGLEGFKQHSNYMRSLSSDAHFEVLDMIAEGDRIVVFGEWRGTWDGVFAVIQGAGQQINRPQANIYEFKDGKVFRGLTRSVDDQLTTGQKFGLIPSMDVLVQQYKESHNLE